MRAPTPSIIGALALFAAACGGPSGDARPATPTPSAGHHALMTRGCTACHSSGLMATALAPSLEGMSRYWHEDDLVGFLRDPASFVQRDERIARLAANYAGRMPPAVADEATLRLIARYLLAQ